MIWMMWQGTLTTSADVTKRGWVAQTPVGPQQEPHNLQQRRVQSPAQDFFCSKEKNSLFTETFLSVALQLSYSCRGTGNVFPHSSWEVAALPSAALALSVQWFHLGALDCRRLLWHTHKDNVSSPFQGTWCPMTQRGSKQERKKLKHWQHDAQSEQVSISYFPLRQILLLQWNRWSLLHFYSLPPKSSSDDSLRLKKIKNQAT